MPLQDRGFIDHEDHLDAVDRAVSTPQGGPWCYSPSWRVFLLHGKWQKTEENYIFTLHFYFFPTKTTFIDGFI